MYMRIKVANLDDAKVLRDMCQYFGDPNAVVDEPKPDETGWWFVRTQMSPRMYGAVKKWADKNVCKIFETVSSSGLRYCYE